MRSNWMSGLSMARLVAAKWDGGQLHVVAVECPFHHRLVQIGLAPAAGLGVETANLGGRPP